MRFFEFSGDVTTEKFVMILKNIIGTATTKKSPAKINWAALDNLAKKTGTEISADYQTFKSMYDSSPAIQALVKNFDDDGIELNVPGTDDVNKDRTQTPQDSQAAVDKIAASAAPQQLAAQA